MALDFLKPHDICITKGQHLPNMDERLNQISSKLSRNEINPILISVLDLVYAYEQMKLAPETSQSCNFALTGENNNGHYRFPKGFYGQADIPTTFQEKIDPKLGPRDFRMAKLYNCRKARNDQTIHPKTGIINNKTKKRRLKSKQKRDRNSTKKHRMSGTYNLTNQVKHKTGGISKLNVVSTLVRLTTILVFKALLTSIAFLGFLTIGLFGVHFRSLRRNVPFV